MGRTIYRYKQFVIMSCEDGYVVVNTNGEYEHHAHCKSFTGAKALCKLASKKQLPRSTNSYFVMSLIRISKDSAYIRQLQSELNNILRRK